MGFDINNPYFRNEVLTASPEKLRLLLLDGCLHFLSEGREGLLSQDFERVYTGFGQARDIVLELISGMNRDANPNVCDKLSALYTFVFKHLTEASFEKDVAKADECIRIMRYERETWAMLMQKMAGERSAPPESSQPRSAPATAGAVVRATSETPTSGRGVGTYGPPPRAPGGPGQGMSFSA